MSETSRWVNDNKHNALLLFSFHLAVEKRAVRTHQHILQYQYHFGKLNTTPDRVILPDELYLLEDEML